MNSCRELVFVYAGGQYVSFVEVGMGEDRNRGWIETGCSAVEQTAVTAASEPQCGDTARCRHCMCIIQALYIDITRRQYTYYSQALYVHNSRRHLQHYICILLAATVYTYYSQALYIHITHRHCIYTLLPGSIYTHCRHYVYHSQAQYIYITRR